jgi:hypothetical protein
MTCKQMDISLDDHRETKDNDIADIISQYHNLDAEQQSMIKKL